MKNQVQNENEIREYLLFSEFELNNTIIDSEWNETKTDADAENLLMGALDFHDSTIKNITYDKDKMTVVFENWWSSTVILEFQSDISMRYFDIAPEPVYIYQIISDENYIYWVDDEIKSISEIEEDYIVLRGHKLRWKQILDK